MPLDDVTPHPLSARQWAVLLALGILFWFLAAMLIRLVQPLGALHLPWVVLTYALVVPGTAPLIPLIRRAAGLLRAQTVTGVAIVTAMATLCDAQALLWYPALYGPDAPGAAAAVFWGAGVGLLLSVAMRG